MLRGTGSKRSGAVMEVRNWFLEVKSFLQPCFCLLKLLESTGCGYGMAWKLSLGDCGSWV